MQRSRRRQTSAQKVSATLLRDRASHFRWAAQSAKSSFAQEELIGMAIGLEAEADASEMLPVGAEPSDGDTRVA